MPRAASAPLPDLLPRDPPPGERQGTRRVPGIWTHRACRVRKPVGSEDAEGLLQRALRLRRHRARSAKVTSSTGIGSSARRDPKMSDDDCLALAPSAWRSWGRSRVDVRCRESAECLSRLEDGRTRRSRGPPLARRRRALLRSVAQRYADRKHRFELLAEHVVQNVVASSGMDYVRGWITPRSPDGGADFVEAARRRRRARRDEARLLLRQAECGARSVVRLGGDHVARTDRPTAPRIDSRLRDHQLLHAPGPGRGSSKMSIRSCWSGEPAGRQASSRRSCFELGTQECQTPSWASSTLSTTGAGAVRGQTLGDLARLGPCMP